MVTWDPDQYERFEDHRSRPFHELVTAIGATDPRYVVDLGCGTGALTASLNQTWPNAFVEGVDSSPEMLRTAAAYAVPGRLHFVEGDAATWRPAQPADVLVSNAMFQWVPDHEAVLVDLMGSIAPAGWLAFQVPGNFGSPSHVLLREVLAAPRWQRATNGLRLRADAVLDPAGYFHLLSDAGCVVDAWETTYSQVLTGDDPVLEWTKGTALRPVLDALSTTDTPDFLADYAAALRSAYPRTPHGTLLPFRRIFVVAQRKAA